MTRKVFVVNDGGKDYSAAEKFGELIFCTDSQFNRKDVASMHRQLMETMGEAEAQDLIMVAGLPALLMVAAGIMAATYGELHLLIFDGTDYVQRDLIF